MCNLFKTPDMPPPPPPAPPPPGPQATRLFDPLSAEDEEIDTAFGLAQLRIPTPKVGL